MRKYTLLTRPLLCVCRREGVGGDNFHESYLPSVPTGFENQCTSIMMLRKLKEKQRKVSFVTLFSKYSFEFDRQFCLEYCDNMFDNSSWPYLFCSFLFCLFKLSVNKK